MELPLPAAAVFSSLFGSTGGPYFAMFRRFQQTCPSIDQTTYEVASDDMFNSHTSRTNGAILQGSLGRAVHQRDDYKEFLQMSFIFFGSVKGARVSFRPPGASHHALWMAKVIYNIKIFMFYQQFSLTAKENQSLKETVLFVSHVGYKFGSGMKNLWITE